MKKNIVLFGAGAVGRNTVKVLKKSGVEIQCFADNDEKKIGTQVCGLLVLTLQQIQDKYEQVDWIISTTVKFQSDIKKLLFSVGYQDNIYTAIEYIEMLEGGRSRVDVYRDYCAEYHITSMDEYFDRAETEASLKRYWDDKTPFYQYFKLLNLNNVIELACGRGRHVKYYLGESKKVTLVDILEKNIEICEQRFESYDNIAYYRNNGYDLKDLKDGAYTSLFTYDAMVHFELIDIYSYLKETYRVLIPGGRALFHHSNCCKDYKASFANSIHGRNFNSKMIFAHLADRAGFEVIEQKVIDWGGEQDLDCITVVEKKEQTI